MDVIMWNQVESNITMVGTNGFRIERDGSSDEISKMSVVGVPPILQF